MTRTAADTSPERVADLLRHLRRESLVVHRTPIGVGGSLLRSADLIEALAAERDALRRVVQEVAEHLYDDGVLTTHHQGCGAGFALSGGEIDAVRAALNETGDADDGR